MGWLGKPTILGFTPKWISLGFLSPVKVALVHPTYNWIRGSRLVNTVELLMATRNPVNSPVEVGSLSHYLQGFLHPRWL